MPLIIEYIIKLSLCLGITLLFYRVLLSRLTFYNWNRWYLLGYSLLSFIIPVIDIMPSLQKRNLQEGVFIQWVPSIKTALQTQTAATQSLDIWQVVIVALIIGVLFFTLRFAVRLLSLYRLRKNSIPVTSSPVKIYQVNEPISPFSFGTSMYIHAQQHNSNELHEIIRHEFVHIKQLHSIDIVLVEILCIINWFNPFAWLIKKAVKQNLEFIADRKMLEKCSSKKQYQYLLLKVMGNTQFSFANNFNFISLKKRIAMMNKNKTAQIHLSRFLFLLPVIGVSLLSFRNIELRNIAKEDPQTTGIINMLADIEPVKNISEVAIKDEPLLKTVVNDTLRNVGTVIINWDGASKLKTVLNDTPRNIGKVIVTNINTTNNSIFNDSLKQPLIVINGIISNKQTLEAIDPNAVNSVQILKNETAIALYGERGKNGVIIIATYKNENNPMNKFINRVNIDSSGYKQPISGAVSGLKISPTETSASPNKNLGTVTISSENVKRTLDDVIFIIDGNIVSKEKVEALSPELIKNIRVLKGEDAIKLYGDKAKSGVIEINTKQQ